MDLKDFWAKAQLKTKEITVEDFGTLTIQELSAKELEKMQDYEGKNAELPAYVVSCSVLNDAGALMFDYTDMEDLVALTSVSILTKISAEVVKLSGLITEDDETDPKEAD